MKKVFFNFIITLLFICITASCSSDVQAPHLLIVHSNDTHSQIDPCPADDKFTPGEGGVVQRAAILEAMRAADSTLLYLDAGDMVQGSPYFNIYKGELEMEAMNEEGLVATTFGNHEFDNGIDFLVNMCRRAKFQFVSANYDCSATALAPYVKPSLIIERNGLKIGLLGVTCDPDGMIFKRNYAGIVYSDPVEAANKVAAGLKAAGCDLIILLSHVGYDDSDTLGDRRIALHSRDIDLIIGGHSHTNLEHGCTVMNAVGRPVMITQTGGKVHPLGCIDIRMQQDTCTGSKARWMVDRITCSKLHPDSLDLSGRGRAMEAFIAPYRTSLESRMQQSLGYAPTTMDKDRPQSLLGNFTADALRYMGEKTLGRHVSLAIMNNGGLRSTINRGDVTLGDLYKVYPFENTLNLIELQGCYLDTLIQSMAGRGLEALSGCSITLRTGADHKTTATRVLVDGRPIDPARFYWIATIDYLAEGNGGMGALLQCRENRNTGILLRDVMIDYVKELTAGHREVTSQLDDRAIVVR